MGIFPTEFSGSGFFDNLARLFGVTPANAQPADGPVQTPRIPPPQLGPLGPLERIPEAFGGLLNGGNLIHGAFNAANTLLTGARTDPSSISRNNQSIMYHNLRNQGLTHEQALMAIMNPKVGEAAGTELMKGTINPQMTIGPEGTIFIQRPYGQVTSIGGVPISERAPDTVNAAGEKVPGGFLIKPSLRNPQGAVVNPYGAGQRPLTPPAPRAPVPGNVTAPVPSDDPTMTVSPRQVAEANRPPITELSPLTKSEQEKTGGDLAGTYKAYRDAGTAASKKLSTLSRMTQLSDTAYEGKGGPAQLYVRSLLTSFGMKPSPTATASEELESLSNKLTLDAQNGSLGAGVSNADVQFIQNINPNLSTTAEGRREIIATATALARRDQQVAAMATEWRRKNGSIEGFDTYIAQWAEQNPLFNFNDRFSAAGRSPSGQRPTEIQEGRTATNPKTGEKIIFKDGKWQPM